MTSLIAVPLTATPLIAASCGSQEFNPWNLSTWGSKKAQIVKDAGANPSDAAIEGALRKINSAVNFYNSRGERYNGTSVNYSYLGKNLWTFSGIAAWGFSGQITIQFKN